ncbi:MAG TPA: PIN domain-containing protein [Pirellulaceae bacterium]|nr:PIN domain-containing protein [Pirellulaceae bacterium]
MDTSGWAAWADQAEQYHAPAQTRIDEVLNQGGQLITTSYVLLELSALLTRMRFDKGRQIRFLTDLKADPSVTVLFIDEPRDAKAWQHWSGRGDKQWTLVDCASFVVMQEEGLTEAITSDHHFEQAGFVRLLK